MSLSRLRERLRATFWLIPALCCVIALALALVLPEIDEYVSDELPFLFPGGPEGARTVLSAIVSAMISFTGLVFSITIVALQLASSQFSPRVLRTFLRSRLTQVALGVFTGTFLYAMVVLRSVRGGEQGAGAFVPQIAVTTATLFVLGSVALFVAYIHHMTQSIRISRIVASVGAETRELLAGSDWPPVDDAGPVPGGVPMMIIRSPGAGVLVKVDRDRLVEVARTGDAVLVQRHPTGVYLAEGMPIFDVYPSGTTSVSVDTDDITPALRLNAERTMEQDLAFGLRQLVDIAERALSPGINDPTTAVQALDQIHDLLRRIVAGPNPRLHLCDDAGALRLVAADYSVVELIDLGVDEILHYGKNSLQISRKMSVMLDDLLVACRPEYQETLLDKQRLLAAANADREKP